MSALKVILVVEDEPVTREGLNIILSREGYQVLMAANGDEALASLRCLRPDLILLDMLMPKLDGWRFLERLNAENPRPAVPVIVVTSTILSREWAKDHGYCGFVRKPIDPRKMLDEIRHCLAENSPQEPLDGVCSS